jgi:hypothetical protein
LHLASDSSLTGDGKGDNFARLSHTQSGRSRGFVDGTSVSQVVSESARPVFGPGDTFPVTRNAHALHQISSN